MSKEAKTAIIILLGVGSFIFGYNFLKSTPLFSSDKNYHAVFTHSGGLQTGTNVTVNGVTVGAVKKIQIDPATAKIIVSFSCKKDFTFSKNSKAEIYSSLLGNTGLQILPALDGAAQAQPGDTLPYPSELDGCHRDQPRAYRQEPQQGTLLHRLAHDHLLPYPRCQSTTGYQGELGQPERNPTTDEPSFSEPQ